MRTVRVGTRKSQLALAQTQLVIDLLKGHFGDITFETVPMSTVGDQVLDKALYKIGEKNLFTKELEVALERGIVDFVVHSLKDLPTTLPDTLVIAAILEREDPRDALAVHPKHAGKKIHELPEGSIIGTSSVRRTAQLARAFPGLRFADVVRNLLSVVRLDAVANRLREEMSEPVLVSSTQANSMD